jgi:hypothetical protein
MGAVDQKRIWRWVSKGMSGFILFRENLASFEIK